MYLPDFRQFCRLQDFGDIESLVVQSPHIARVWTLPSKFHWACLTDGGQIDSVLDHCSVDAIPLFPPLLKLVAANDSPRVDGESIFCRYESLSLSRR
jgi:hypothetical protein